MIDPLKRGANISHKYKFVWTAPPKVASRSVKDVFRKYCNLNPDWPSDEHTSDFTHVNNWPELAGKDYMHIASIRHPYYRWLSYWKYAYHEQGSHELEDVMIGPIDCLHNMSQDWINGWCLWNLINNTSKKIDFLVRAENLEVSLKKLWFIPEDVVVPTVGKTFTPPIPFDEEHLRQVCYDRFFDDYKNFGYDKDEKHYQWEPPNQIVNPQFKHRKI